MKSFGTNRRGMIPLMVAVSLGAMSALAQASTNEYVLGQWEFDGDLEAEVGDALEYLGDTSEATEFVSMTINGNEAEVMHFPAASPTQGYRMIHGAPPNGEGTKVNVYTLIMDIMYPAGGTWRALLQTSEENADDAEIFVAPWDAIGTDNDTDGVIVPGRWHRVALVFNLPEGTLTKYIDGVAVGENVGAVVDQRLALGETALLFADDSGDTAEGYINSLQFRDYAMTAEEVEELGVPSAAGITSPGVVLPGEFSLSISRDGNNVIITVDEAGTYQLLRASAVNGEYVAEGTPSSSGSWEVPIGQTPAFFMVEQR